MLDVATGEALDTPPRESRAMFLLYWIHFRLHGLPGQLGHWLVGAMAAAMLVLLVTGVIVQCALSAMSNSLRCRVMAWMILPFAPFRQRKTGTSVPPIYGLKNGLENPGCPWISVLFSEP
jgi:hypothetical protein